MVADRPLLVVPSGLGKRGDLRARRAPMIAADLLLLRETDLLGASRDGFFANCMILVALLD